ncbi:hypothetical protein [Spirosoma oryzicola]|uniref:hypothetical protein n=1 Tax=Spirosoma oryzicola TaxID=2898794 RepID=UPI001E4DBF38|nr:hypothetical protein [Spirosoma oryzicola]UHG93258.1 hypothetical protein LQ777_10235 [Spirosoma oryzicola]
MADQENTPTTTDGASENLAPQNFPKKQSYTDVARRKILVEEAYRLMDALASFIYTNEMRFDMSPIKSHPKAERSFAGTLSSAYYNRFQGKVTAMWDLLVDELKTGDNDFRYENSEASFIFEGFTGAETHTSQLWTKIKGRLNILNGLVDQLSYEIREAEKTFNR